MNWKKVTQLFVMILFVSIFLYDAVAIYQGGTEASVSYRIILWSYDFPAFTFLVGFCMGHLFWRMRDTEKTRGLGRFEEGE